MDDQQHLRLLGMFTELRYLRLEITTRCTLTVDNVNAADGYFQKLTEVVHAAVHNGPVPTQQRGRIQNFTPFVGWKGYSSIWFKYKRLPPLHQRTLCRT
jgi:hypothetical protein